MKHQESEAYKRSMGSNPISRPHAPVNVSQSTSEQHRCFSGEMLYSTQWAAETVLRSLNLITALVSAKSPSYSFFTQQRNSEFMVLEKLLQHGPRMFRPPPLASLKTGAPPKKKRHPQATFRISLAPCASICSPSLPGPDQPASTLTLPS